VRIVGIPDSSIALLKVGSSRLGQLVDELGWRLESRRRASHLGKGSTEDVGDGECVDERRRGPLWASTKEKASLMIESVVHARNGLRELGLCGEGEWHAKKIST
jgi:hypothetical protein